MNNVIKIDKYQIRQCDSLNVLLEKQKGSEYKILGYYCNVVNALQGYVKDCMATEKNWTSIDDVIKAYQEINETIKGVING